MKCQCCPHTATSQLIWCANQLTGSYMRATLALNGLIMQNHGCMKMHESLLKLMNKTTGKLTT